MWSQDCSEGRHLRNGSVFVVLVLISAAVALRDGLAFLVAGFKPLSHLEASVLDEPPGLDDHEAPRFLAERDHVDLEVPRDMPAGELLRLYQLAELPHIRRQIAQQESIPRLEDGYVLRKGKHYKITLTPPEE